MLTIGVTDKFKSVAKSPAHNPIAKVVFKYGSTTYNLDNTVLESMSVSKSACVDDKFAIGSVVSGKLTFKMLASHAAASLIHDYSTVDAYMGYHYAEDGESSPSDHYLFLNTYYVASDETEHDGLWVTFVAYDMLLLKSMGKKLPASYCLPQTYLDEFRESLSDLTDAVCDAKHVVDTIMLETGYSDDLLNEALETLSTAIDSYNALVDANYRAQYHLSVSTETATKGVISQGYPVSSATALTDPIRVISENCGSISDAEGNRILDRKCSTAFSPYVNAVNLASLRNRVVDIDDVPTSGDTPVVPSSKRPTEREMWSLLAMNSGMNIMVSPRASAQGGAVRSALTFVKARNPFYVTADETITSRQYDAVTIGDTEKTIVGFLTCNYSADDESQDTVELQYPATVDDTVVGFQLEENSVNSADKLKTIYNRMKTSSSGDVRYLPHDVDLLVGLPYLEPLDVVSLTDITSSTYKLMPFTVEHTFDGALTTKFYASGIEDSSDSGSTTENRIVNTVATAVSTVNTIQRNIAGNYSVCNSFGESQMKRVACPGFTLHTGATITVRFEYENLVDNPYLIVNNTWGENGAKPFIWANNRKLKANDMYEWNDDEIVSFIYDGKHWCITDANPATKMAFEDGRLTLSTDAGSEGFHVDISASTVELMYGQYDGVKIDTASVTIAEPVEDPVSRVVVTNQGVAIEGETSSLSISSDGILLADGNGNIASASASVFQADQMETSNTTYSIDDDSVNSFIWELRSNGHFSLKVG